MRDAEDAVLDLDTDIVDERDDREERDEMYEYCDEDESNVEQLLFLESGCLSSLEWLYVLECPRLLCDLLLLSPWG